LLERQCAHGLFERGGDTPTGHLICLIKPPRGRSQGTLSSWSSRTSIAVVMVVDNPVYLPLLDEQKLSAGRDGSAAGAQR
jgi:hypothetical protein